MNGGAGGIRAIIFLVEVQSGRSKPITTPTKSPLNSTETAIPLVLLSEKFFDVHESTVSRRIIFVNRVRFELIAPRSA
jgi:hypothetical protein